MQHRTDKTLQNLTTCRLKWKLVLRRFRWYLNKALREKRDWQIWYLHLTFLQNFFSKLKNPIKILEVRKVCHYLLYDRVYYFIVIQWYDDFIVSKDSPLCNKWFNRHRSFLFSTRSNSWCNRDRKIVLLAHWGILIRFPGRWFCLEKPEIHDLWLLFCREREMVGKTSIHKIFKSTFPNEKFHKTRLKSWAFSKWDLMMLIRNARETTIFLFINLPRDS